MNKLIDYLQNKLMPIANKLSSNKFLNALGKSFQLLLPIIIIGSFACLGAFVDIKPWQDFIGSSGLIMVFLNLFFVTMKLIAFYLLLILPYQYGKQLGINGVSAIVISVMSYLLLTPTELFASLPAEWMGHAGLFGVLVISLFVCNLMKFCMDKKIYIRMPEGVPTIVEDSFASIIPAFIAAVIAVILANIFAATTFGNFHNFIYSVIQTPLQGLALTLPAYLLMQLLTTLFMFCGIHGSTVTSLFSPLTLAASSQNLAALQAGLPLPQIFTNTFGILAQVGGIGCTLGFTFLLVFKAKSKRLKAVGKVAIIPAIFGISEPTLFGVPIMLNPILFIPYVISPIVCTILSYVTMAIGIVPRLTGTEVSWTVPPILSGFLSQGWQTAVLQVVLIIVTTLIWYPFFKIVDKQIAAEELETGTK
ncbi:MAG: PTS sugar transporter subunit IIC [Erysipelotrichia bacterium]|nr:PTS sugar transporter subunit IIC [Erysipelotrichia bacterium]